MGNRKVDPKGARGKGVSDLTFCTFVIKNLPVGVLTVDSQ
jgi:hypothetical protein